MTTRTCRKPARPGRPHDLKRKRPPSEGRPLRNSDIRTLVNLSEVASVAIADIGISYNADLEQAEQVVRELLAELPGMYPGVFHDQPTFSGVQDLADSAVILRVCANVDEPDIYSARRILLRELKLAMDRAGIEIPFPQVVVHKGEN